MRVARPSVVSLSPCLTLLAVGNTKTWVKRIEKRHMWQYFVILIDRVMIHTMITNKHGFLGRCLSLCARDTISGLWLFDWWHLSSEEAFNYFVNKFQDRALLFPCRANYDCRRTIYGGFSFIFIIEKLSLHGTWQYFFSSDWQWSDDTHHENKKGQSDRQVQKGNRSVVQVRCGARACALIADLSNKKIERDASIWLKQVLFG